MSGALKQQRGAKSSEKIFRSESQESQPHAQCGIEETLTTQNATQLQDRDSHQRRTLPQPSAQAAIIKSNPKLAFQSANPPILTPTSVAARDLDIKNECHARYRFNLLKHGGIDECIHYIGHGY